MCKSDPSLLILVPPSAHSPFPPSDQTYRSSIQSRSPTAAASSDVADASDVSATSSSAVPSASGAILVSRIVSTVIDTASRSQSSALPTGTARVIALTGGALGTQRGVVGWTGAVGLVGAVVLAL